MAFFSEHRSGFIRLLSVLAVSLVLTLAVADRATAEISAPPETVADSFAALLDAGETAAAWQAFTPMARVIKNEEQWQRLHKTLRSAYGPVEQRTLRGITEQNRYPMLPDGRYALVQFDTTFLHKQNAIETAILTLGPDGNWQVHDYVIN